jgi:energy-coupling factor transporter transmembrane protein EcfT
MISGASGDGMFSHPHHRRHRCHRHRLDPLTIIVITVIVRVIVIVNNKLILTVIVIAVIVGVHDGGGITILRPYRRILALSFLCVFVELGLLRRADVV